MLWLLCFPRESQQPHSAICVLFADDKTISIGTRAQKKTVVCYQSLTCLIQSHAGMSGKGKLKPGGEESKEERRDHHVFGKPIRGKGKGKSAYDTGDEGDESGDDEDDPPLKRQKCVHHPDVVIKELKRAGLGKFAVLLEEKGFRLEHLDLLPSLRKETPPFDARDYKTFHVWDGVWRLGLGEFAKVLLEEGCTRQDLWAAQIPTMRRPGVYETNFGQGRDDVLDDSQMAGSKSSSSSSSSSSSGGSSITTLSVIKESSSSRTRDGLRKYQLEQHADALTAAGYTHTHARTHKHSTQDTHALNTYMTHTHADGTYGT
jgi:hypothetical protein